MIVVEKGSAYTVLSKRGKLDAKSGKSNPLLFKLILFEFIVSVIMLLVGHLIGNAYVRGVGIGLIIAWVTSGLAYWKTERGKGRKS